ncbi:MAG: ATP-dependent DNA helicase [Bacillota bacterium]
MNRAFAADGPISRAIPGFEKRPQQLEMALSVWDSLANGGHLLVEAGTGTGKSLAYIFPLVLWAARTSKRAIISTHTVNLQSQLFGKDIPISARIFGQAGFELSYSIFKGRSHYLCLRRWNQTYSQVQDQSALFTPNAEDKLMMSLADLIDEGDWDGDRDTLPLSIPGRIWGETCSESDRCMSTKCRFRENCYYQKHKRGLEKCHLIVVNHALLVSHLAISHESKGQAGLLPAFDAAVFDEGHHLEDVTRDSLGTEVSESRLRRLADDTVRKASTGELGKAVDRDDVRNLRVALDNLVTALGSGLKGLTIRGRDKARLLDPGKLDSAIAKNLREIGRSIGEWEDLDLSDEERFEVSALRKRFSLLAGDLESVANLEGSGEDCVYWSEVQETARRASVVVRRSPIEVGPYLREALWDELHSGIVTSATLAVGGTFDYIKKMLCLHNAQELILGSPFKFEEQACLCVPRDSQGRDVNSPDFSDYIGQKVLEIVDLTQGRTFVLFTNSKSLERVASAFRDRIEEKGYPVLKQGDAPRETLLEEFKQHGNAVLFGLDSFWEGVDVPGSALSCVVLTKLPFPVPDDPVMQAREELWKLQGIQPFTYYSLPLTTLKLKQGFGRLIRTKTDRGAVVLLDPRIMMRSYGRVILKSLPPARLSHDIDDIALAVASVTSASAGG